MNRRRLLARMLVVALVASVVSVVAEPAMAITVPETLADRRPVQRGPVEPGFPIDYVGVLWDTEASPLGHDETAPEPHGAIRFRHDGVWGTWRPLTEDGAASEGRWSSGLVSGDDAEAYQVRGVPAEAIRPRAAALNTTDGPAVKVGEVRGGAAHALDGATCRSREDWGADPALMTWAPEYFPVQVLTVHHTATDNDDADPEATIRAIYRYHAVDNGWGDIGYQYLVDESGVVYEGRYSGVSRSCKYAAGDGTFGDGSDFGHEEGDGNANGVTGEMVTGAHTGGANSGNMGIALLGEFTDHKRFGADPKAAAVSSLEDVMAELAVRHGLAPTETGVRYTNPVNGSEKVVAAISGHRDWSSTECPGQRLYGQLDTIRQNTADKMAADDPPTVSITAPVAGAVVAGTTRFTAAASDDDEVTGVSFHIDTSTIPATRDVDGSWSATWDTTQLVDGSYDVTAVATDTASQSTTSAPVSVTVDNVADPPPEDEASTTMYVADLTGQAVARKNAWRANVTVTVVDGSGAAVAQATVGGDWSDGTSATCTTDDSGTCQLFSSWVPKSTSSLTYTVSSVSHASLTYDPSSNVESSVTVVKP